MYKENVNQKVIMAALPLVRHESDILIKIIKYFYSKMSNCEYLRQIV